MDIEVDFGGDEEGIETEPPKRPIDPDQFLAENSFRIVYQTNNFFLPQVRDLIEKGETINLRPEYQRRLRWSNSQKSKLIESLMLNIPVPPVFFYENEAARYEVMDGQQRLSAIRDFFAGDFALTGLKVLHPLNGMRYTKCPPRIKRTLDRASISAIVLLLESEKDRQGKNSDGVPDRIADIRRLVFDRLNTGGRTLNAQEIRNALNPGPFNEAIVSITRSPKFTEVFGIPEYNEKSEEDFYENPARQKNALYKTMRDCELVLRFFALRDDENIRGSMKSMLDRAMEHKASQEEAAKLTKEFLDRLDFLTKLFNNKPFLIPTGGSGGSKVSAALFDASMVAIDQLWNARDAILNDAEGVGARLNKAFQDSDAYEIIVGRANTAESVKDRIKLMKGILSAET